MSTRPSSLLRIAFAGLVLSFAVTADRATAATSQPRALGPLPAIEAPSAELAELGKLLFFDQRLSGDAVLACGSCHRPEAGWTDGQQLGIAYPGTLYFRNTKSVLNAAHARYFYWDGRLTGKDMPTQVRDSITETHFQNMDGRIMLERLKQVPEYVRRFRSAMNAEPSFGATLKAISAYEKTLVSRNVPFDKGTMSQAATRGQGLFEGKAACIQCHEGPMLSDYQPHRTGVAGNPEITRDPLRHLTLRSFAKFMGVPGFEIIREDPGFFTVSKQEEDRGKFVTPTLREVSRTAPYMHNGTIATLVEVIDFYNAGGGTAEGRDPLLKPLDLNAAEKTDLLAFLEALSGDAIEVGEIDLPPYEAIADWRSVPN